MTATPGAPASAVAPAPCRVPVLLLAGPDPALLDDAAARLAAALSEGLRVAVLRNGMPPARDGPPAGSTLVVRDAGAACACCTGAVAARVALARLQREGIAAGGWHRLFVLGGPGTHAGPLAKSLRTAFVEPPRCIAVVPGDVIVRLDKLAPSARQRLVDLFECVEAWLQPEPDHDRIERAAPASPGVAAIAAQRPRITWDALVALARDPGTSLASNHVEGGPRP